MAEDKKSFILYADLLSVVKKLVEKDRLNKTNYGGELFLIILEYVNDLNPIPVDFIVEMAFEPIKLQLKRDLIRWSEYREKQSLNGQKGGRPKKDTGILLNPKNPSLYSESQKSLNVNDTVNVNVNVNESVSVSENIYTPTQIFGLNVIKPYNDLPEEYRKMYDKQVYDNYCRMNEHIHQNCKYLKDWGKQITIHEFKSIFDRANKGEFKKTDINEVLSDLDGSKKAQDNYQSVYHGFNKFMKTRLDKRK